MKKNIKVFFKTVYITSTVIICVLIGIIGSFKAYESIRLIGFGEYRSAVEYKDGVLSFFDFEINIMENS